MRKIESEIFRMMDHWLDYKWKLDELPGISIGIVINNKTVFAKSYGFADVEKKVKASTLTTYRIASISKTFTAIGILKLQEQGKLKLDDLVIKYLPEFKSKLQPSQNKITIRQLLNHKSLIKRDGSFGQWENFKFPKEKQLFEEAQKGIKISPKENNWKYSNFGYSFLGLVIERVSGMSYEDFMQKIIIRPLELKHTSSLLKNPVNNKLATGYIPARPKLPRKILKQIETYDMAAATGFSSNIEDLIKYVKAIINSSPKILKASSWRKAFKQQWKYKEDKRNLFLLGSTKNNQLGHGGGFPGFVSRIQMDIKNKVGIVALLNSNPGPLQSYITGLFDIVNKSEQLYKTVGKFKTKPPHPHKFEGQYASIWGITEIINIKGQLVGFGLGPFSPMDDLAYLEYKGGNSFTIHDSFGFGNDGEKAEFISKNGKIIGLDWGGHYGKKLK